MKYQPGKWYAFFCSGGDNGGAEVGPFETRQAAWTDCGGDCEWLAQADEQGVLKMEGDTETAPAVFDLSEVSRDFFESRSGDLR